MSTRNTSTQRTQLGLESVYGTAVPTTKRLPNLAMIAGPMVTTKEAKGQGFKYASALVKDKEWTGVTFDGMVSYDELPYLLCSYFANTSAAPLGGTPAAYLWAIQHSYSNPESPASFTIQHGDSNFCGGAAGLVVDALTLALTRDELKASGTGVAQYWTDGQTFGGANDVQTLTITATGGDYRLTFEGQQTADIPYNATASTIQTAIQALSSVGSGNILVTAAGPFVFTAAGTLAGQQLPAILVESSGTTPLTGGTATMTHTTVGGPTIIGNVPVVPGNIKIYCDSTFAGIGTTQLLSPYSAQLAMTGRWNPDWPINGALSSFADPVEMAPKATLKLEIKDDGDAAAFLAQFRAGSTRYLRIQATGPVISGAIAHQFTLDLAVQVSVNALPKDLAGVYVAEYTLAPVADPVAGFAINAQVINTLASL